jgi:transcriptional regulator
MYIRASHQPRSTADVIRIIKEHMFATIITSSPAGMIASHLPFMIDETRGAQGTLLAHMARANPQSSAIGGEKEALVIFEGPHAYISPSWYEDRATAPTWDYIAVHCYGKTRRHSDEEALQNIERLIAIVEAQSANPWRIEELTAQEVHSLLQNVVSFEIPISRMEGKFKLNRGEQPQRTRAAIAQLEQRGEHALAEYMRLYNEPER